jgi:hypothetical protein
VKEMVLTFGERLESLYEQDRRRSVVDQGQERQSQERVVNAKMGMQIHNKMTRTQQHGSDTNAKKSHRVIISDQACKFVCLVPDIPISACLVCLFLGIET